MNLRTDKTGRVFSKQPLNRKRRSRSKAIRIPNELVLGIVLVISIFVLQEVFLGMLGVSNLARVGGI